jgi:hypothetical protein
MLARMNDSTRPRVESYQPLRTTTVEPGSTVVAPPRKRAHDRVDDGRRVG